MSVKEQEIQPVDDVIDLGLLLKRLWSGRGIIIGVTVFVVAVVLAIFIGRIFAAPSYVESSIQVQFTFSGAEKGEYPNGTPFRLSDVISSQALNRVYNKYELNEDVITLEEFTSRISIVPFAINRAFIDARYKGRLDNKKLSQAEIDEIERAYKLELEAATKRSARLTYMAPENDTLPVDLVKSILFALPEVWAKYAVQERGVLEVPVVSVSAFNVQRLSSEEYVAAVSMMRDDIKRVKESLSAMMDDARMSMLRDPEYQMTAEDLLMKFNTFSKYQLDAFNNIVLAKSVYQDRDRAETFLLGRKQRLEDQIAEIDRTIAIYDNAFNRHATNASGGQAGGRESNAATQLGSDTIGQLLNLGDDLSESKYRQKLTDKQIELSRQASALSGELAEIERMISGLGRNGDGSEELVQSEYESLLADYISLLNIYGSLALEARESSLSDTQALYQYLSSNVALNKGSSAQLKSSIKYTVLALLLGLMLGIMVALVRAVFYAKD